MRAHSSYPLAGVFPEPIEVCPMTTSASSATRLRRELAAAFRLAEKFGYSEGICNHFSVVVPGSQERYLINPYGLHWSEMRPEHLLLIDGDGQVIDGDGEVEATARHIHVQGHRANPRHQCILHVHMPWATSLTMVQGCRLEMAHQTAARFYGRIIYQSFGGIALDESEGKRIAEAQMSNPGADVFFLAHHGVSIGGPSISFAFDDLYYLERACKQQVLAMSTGRPLEIMPEDQVKDTARQYMQLIDIQAQQHFDALMRINGL
jgi:ribulose-5-phosphate 4-epimerase/fuculose-1-phosphate aldolase